MSAPLAERLSRAATLDAELFAELGADAQATGQSIGVAISVALVQGLAGLGAGGPGFFGAVADAAARWLFWVLAVHGIALGLGHASELAALVRALGFASLPLALGALAGLPLLGPLSAAAGWILAVAASTIAIRRLLALETGPALAVALGGLAIAWLLALPVGWLSAG
jgi:hypothetical protein